MYRVLNHEGREMSRRSTLPESFLVAVLRAGGHVQALIAGAWVEVEVA